MIELVPPPDPKEKLNFEWREIKERMKRLERKTSGDEFEKELENAKKKVNECVKNARNSINDTYINYLRSNNL